MNTFFDSSALVKRYVEEDGRERVINIFEEASAIGVSVICFSEVISAFCRLQREGSLDKPQYERIKGDMIADFEDFFISAITPQVRGCVTRLLETYSLRAMDALHLGSAIEWQANTFVSGDKRQIIAAQNEGLDVVDVRDE